MPYKDDLDAEIAGCIAGGYPPPQVARKLYGFRSSPILQANSQEAFEILNQVALRFGLPFRAVVAVGSAHTGYSYIKERDFEPKTSDLDLAVIDTRLFCRYSELTFFATKGYTDLTPFRDAAQHESFRAYLTKGIFRPDMMPNCSAKSDWFTFFNRLSMKHPSLFASVNCGIYQSDVFFDAKLASIVDQHNKVKK